MGTGTLEGGSGVSDDDNSINSYTQVLCSCNYHALIVLLWPDSFMGLSSADLMIHLFFRMVMMVEEEERVL